MIKGIKFWIIGITGGNMLTCLKFVRVVQMSMHYKLKGIP